MSSKTKRKYTFDDSDESSEELIIPRTSKKTKDSEQTKSPSNHLAANLAVLAAELTGQKNGKKQLAKLLAKG